MERSKLIVNEFYIFDKSFYKFAVSKGYSELYASNNSVLRFTNSIELCNYNINNFVIIGGSKLYNQWSFIELSDEEVGYINIYTPGINSLIKYL